MALSSHWVVKEGYAPSGTSDGRVFALERKKGAHFGLKLVASKAGSHADV